MDTGLQVRIGHFSHKGVKASNQDFHGAVLPNQPQRSLKGVALAIADGISSSDVSHIASESAVASFLTDYFSTSEAWSVRTAGIKVIDAINGWLWAQTQRTERRFNKDTGYVCTFSAVVFKGKSAHLFHVGDSRIYRLRAQVLEQLTKDHRAWTSTKQSYLSRALGIDEHVEIDYHTVDLLPGDTLILCTDGVYEHCTATALLDCLSAHSDDLSHACKSAVFHALNAGSQDNLTIQIAQIDQLPTDTTSLLQSQLDSLSLPSLLKASDEIDDYRVVRELHANSRSHVYLVENTGSNELSVLKIPSIELRDDPAYLERFLIEEWVARRIDNPHVMKAQQQLAPRTYLYTVMEYIDGISLQQWLVDNPKPDIEAVRNIVEQIAKGLYALHRLEILHQDLKPDNIIINRAGTVKIIDFGGVCVAGIAESQALQIQADWQGTAMYMAPEYFIGEAATIRSDQYSLAVITYHLLSGRFPYGTHLAKARSVSAQKRLIYQSVRDDEREIPAWMDFTLRKALSIQPHKRYDELSEFVHELRHPSAASLAQVRPPLIDRNPLLFWKSACAVLLISVIGLLVYINQLMTLPHLNSP